MSTDLFVPDSSADAARVTPLHTITLLTTQGAALEKALVEGFELAPSNWISSTETDRADLNSYLGLSHGDAWRCAAFNGTGDRANVSVRVIEVTNSSTGKVLRPEIDGRYLGGLSIGFPMADMQSREKTLGELGINSTIGVKEMEFTGPSGEVYVSAEVHFPVAENVFLLGVRRPDVFVPVGPMNAQGKIGAAAYSARCTKDTDNLLGFYSDVLGYEIRRDASFEVTGDSGLRLPKGCPERFIQAFAPGASSGYLVFLDHDAERHQPITETLGPPNRGLVMWSFGTGDLSALKKDAVAAGCTVLAEPGAHASPFLPAGDSMIIADPGGFPLEFFES